MGAEKKEVVKNDPIVPKKRRKLARRERYFVLNICYYKN
jgi:hypothetical protein